MDKILGDGVLSIFKTRALVLKTTDLNDNDKLVWLFTEKLGKVCAVAKGAKKSRSKFMATTLQFCYGEYVLFRGKSLYTINECEIIDSFQDLLGDLDKITYASYLNELIDISLVDEESNRALFKVFITSFYLMKTGVGDLELLIRSFELKILRLTGYGLSLDNCSTCGKNISKSNYISLKHYGAVCENCEKDSGIYISNACYNILRYLSRAPIDKVYRIEVKDVRVKSELYKVMSELIIMSYSKKPKSLDMFNFIKKE